MRYVCERCGAPLQATIPLWLTFDESGQPRLAFSPAVEVDAVRLYCDQDHDDGMRYSWVEVLSARATDYVNASLGATS
jgi:hypothetical protein